MDKKQQPKHYYSTYFNEIYQQKDYDTDADYYLSLTDKHNNQPDYNAEYTNNSKYKPKPAFGVRASIIIIAAIIGSLFFGSQGNKEAVPENFSIDLVISPANIFDIQSLQIPAVGYKVNNKALFMDLLKKIKSTQFAQQFADSALYHPLLKIRRGIEIGERPESAQLSFETANPEGAQQWLNGFLTFAQQAVLNNYVDAADAKISDIRNKVQLEIDKVYQQANLESQTTKDKIARYQKAVKKAKAKGIINRVSAQSIPKEQRFGDLLYLQGYWKLEAQIKYFKLTLSRQSVDIESQELVLNEIKDLNPKINQLKAFAIEQVLKVKDLTDYNRQQSVWSFLGTVIGAIFGWILSYLFRRIKLKRRVTRLKLKKIIPCE